MSFKNGDRFCEGVSFEDITELYEFDKKLRHLLLDIIECVEIAFLTHIAYHLAHKYGALGYLDKSNFNNEWTIPYLGSDRNGLDRMSFKVVP